MVGYQLYTPFQTPTSNNKGEGVFYPGVKHTLRPKKLLATKPHALSQLYTLWVVAKLQIPTSLNNDLNMNDWILIMHCALYFVEMYVVVVFQTSYLFLQVSKLQNTYGV